MTYTFKKMHDEIILIENQMAELRIEINRNTRYLQHSHALIVEHTTLQEILNEKYKKFINLSKSTTKILTKDREREKNVTRKDIQNKFQDKFEIKAKKAQLDLIEEHIKKYVSPDIIILREQK